MKTRGQFSEWINRAARPNGLTVGQLARLSYHAFRDEDLLTYASALAFHAMLALFPFLLFLLAIVSFLDAGFLFERLLFWSSTVFPPKAMEQISEVVTRFREEKQTGLLSIGIVGTLWAASGGIRSAMNGLNRAYRLKDRRSTWRRYGMSVVFTIGVGLLLLIGMALMLIGPRLANWAAALLGLDGLIVGLWRWLRLPVAVVMLIFGSALAYALLPFHHRFHFLTHGAVVAVVIWIGGSLGFQLYLSVFGKYDVLYGSFGAVVVLLLYLWLSSLALMLGGVINAAIEQSGSDHRERETQ